MIHFSLEEKAMALEEVVVESRGNQSVLKEPFSGVVSLNRQQLKSIPALLGEADIGRSLQYLPGVTSAGEGASGNNIRGGRTDQNLMLINDA
ncbi:MAG: TonB-dependent receptor, partial [Cyclobacteriaceae bacterium]